MSRWIVAALAAGSTSTFAFAQAPKPVQESDVVTVTAVEAIDRANRQVTLKDEINVTDTEALLLTVDPKKP